MIIIWLSLIAIILLAIELYMLTIDIKKNIYINGNKNHSIEHITYITTSIVLLISLLFYKTNNLINIILIFNFIIISFHLKNERLDSFLKK